MLAAELGRELRVAIEALPPAQRTVLELRDVQGLTAAEVCELLDLSEANQRVLLHRGRSKARAVLDAACCRPRRCPDAGPPAGPGRIDSDGA